MPLKETLEQLLLLTDQLAPQELERSSFFADFQKLNASVSSADLQAASTPRFSFEKTEFRTRRTLSEKDLKRLGRVAEKMQEAERPAYRIFRREVPLAQSLAPGSQPDWAVGLAPERSFGPFTGRDGRKFWYDFFPIIQLMPLYLPGQSDPALLFYVSSLQRKISVGLPSANQVIQLFQGAKYNLAGSSIWIRADLLANGPSTKDYVGLKIGGGTITLSKKPQNIAGKLTIPAGATCTVDLKLKQDAPPTPSAGNYARDVKDATLELPKTFAFHFTAAAKQIDAVGDANWNLYGQKTDFTYQGASPGIHISQLKTVFIPLQATKPAFQVKKSKSYFAQAAGKTQIQQSAWALPTSQIDVNLPTPAPGIGGLAIVAGEGLSLNWRGLRDGPIQLPQPWIILYPGLLTIADLQAGNLYANQRFLMWKDDDSAYRSSVELQFTDSFPLFYLAGSQGAEIVFAETNAESRQDRPVDVAGRAMEVKTKKSLFVLSYTETLQLVYLYDDNILVDNLDPNVPLPQQFPKPKSLAIRNALFTTTPVNGFLLFAELLDEEMIDQGHLLLVFGLYGILPSLPDPYAANIGLFRTANERGVKSRYLALMLVCYIPWTHSTDEETADNVHTNFFILPLGLGGKNLLASGDNAQAAPDIATPGATTFASSSRQKPLEPEWDRLFWRFYIEQFALLDVSTNADWMGVSFAWFNSRRVSDNDYVFYQIYGAQDTDDQTQALFPLQVQGMDLIAQAKFVRAFTVPQISWEPLYNLTEPDLPGQDPPDGFNFYPNDGGPTRLFNDNPKPVPIAPLPKIDELLDYYHNIQGPNGFTGALFTLPYGLKAFAEFNKHHPDWADVGLGLNQASFRENTLKGGLQLQVDAPSRYSESAMFIGGTLQLNNIVLFNGTPTNTGTLGYSVADIFNREFFFDYNGYSDRGVPLERIDFSGYGANIFSNWENPEAEFAATSQARFDVFRGRTAHEVIQVKSVVYPWGIRVVRTIVIFRAGSGYGYRYDTGWQAESPGLYDFSYNVKTTLAGDPIKQPNPFEFHSGLIKGVHNVRNITETPDIPPFEETWYKVNGVDHYFDSQGLWKVVDNSTPANQKSPDVKLMPVYFDADVEMYHVKSGGFDGKAPVTEKLVSSKGMLGYVQLAPRGEPIPPSMFKALLEEQFGSLGGPVDCLVDIGDTGQQMRVAKVDVSLSEDQSGKPIFVSSARGSVILPKEGSWSVVQYLAGSGEVSPLPENATVPLIQQGVHNPNAQPTGQYRLDNPLELVRSETASSIFYGLLQTTDTQKALFPKPRYDKGVKKLKIPNSLKPLMADAYRILNTNSIFPNLADTLPMDLSAQNLAVDIIEEGFKLANNGVEEVLEQVFPDEPLFLINEDFLKLYIEYFQDESPSNGKLNFGFDSSPSSLIDPWATKLEDIQMVVDLGPLPRLMRIKGKFDTKKGGTPGFVKPDLKFSDALQPVIDILQVLLMLNEGDYGGALSKGLEIAMSNSADSWEYAFHARKEIPLIKFPPGDLYDNPTNPLKLECGLSTGVYFNESFSLTSSPEQLIPSAGAYLGFYGRLSVMCTSVGAATVYATGSVDLQIGADIKTGPSLKMAFGFGVEVNAGMPKIGTVSLLFMVGVEMYLDSTQVSVTAFLYFRGNAEILGGIVSITISLEAKGTIQRQLGAPDEKTDMIAQVTFGLDISIFMIINISFTESWQETRQIA